MRSNIAVGIVCLGLVIVFGVQLRPEGQLATALYPIVVLGVIALLGLGLLVAGLARRGPNGAVTDEGAAEGAAPRPSWRLFVLALVALVGWSVAVGLVGFAISGTICFVAVVWLVRKGKLTPKAAGVDVLVAVVCVVACALVFTRVLGVPLPVSAVLGI